MAIAHRFTSSEFNETGKATVDIPKPTGLADGDVMIAFIHSDNANAAQQTITPPSGWVAVPGITASLNAGVSGGHFAGAYYKVVSSAAGEPATMTFTLLHSEQNCGTISAYSGVDDVTPFDVNGSISLNASSTNILATGITTVTANTVLMGAFCYNSSTFAITKPASMTDRANSGAVGYSLDVAEEAQAGIGASGNRTATAGTARDNIGMLVALRLSGAATGQPFQIREQVSVPQVGGIVNAHTR